MGSQTFPGSLGRNFVGSKFRIILICNEQMLVYMFVGMLIPVQGLPTKAMKIGPPQ